ncbi:MAG: prolipoprotein diacylglyceryl transferase [Spirochaetaceae bacterium]|jgi:phosphatidylglycerol:prolipoprotein diacylglycerol transferase|nr:prolipoprotein diacylglyceryl transferase [Spirochaetaceae bacterium]
MLLAVNFPSWLHPEIIPGLPFRWYGLMYLIAFGIAYFLVKKQVKEQNYPLSEDDISGLFFWGIFGLLVGARIFSTLVYETDDTYVRSPWLIFWPFRDGVFTGLQGMSYHGGLIGCLLAVLLYCKKKRFPLRDIGDMVAIAIPLGYTFGRLGNFINAELYGRVSAGPLGMIFPYAEKFPVRLEWVRNIALKAGIALEGAEVNLPRHPSQLYEALFEGVILWAILWLLRKRRPFRGFFMGAYFLGYGVFRFFIEYFRTPDADIGYRIELVRTNVPPALFSSFFNFSTGQILCFLMIAGSLGWLWAVSRMRDAAPLVFEAVPEETEEKDERRADRNSRRNMRKKLR